MYHFTSRADSLPESRKITLVVDRDSMFRHFAMRSMRRLGMSVVGLRSAEDALAWIDANRAATLITLDTSLSGMDGFNLCMKIRQHPRSSMVPIICTGAPGEPDGHARALNAGATVYLRKPVLPNLYLEAAARVLRSGALSACRSTSDAISISECRFWILSKS